MVTLDSLFDDLRRFHVPPRRSMARRLRCECTDNENAQLDSLGLPEHSPPSKWLPYGVLAVIFEGDGMDRKVILVNRNREAG